MFLDFSNPIFLLRLSDMWHCDISKFYQRSTRRHNRRQLLMFPISTNTLIRLLVFSDYQPTYLLARAKWQWQNSWDTLHGQWGGWPSKAVCLLEWLIQWDQSTHLLTSRSKCLAICHVLRWSEEPKWIYPDSGPVRVFWWHAISLGCRIVGTGYRRILF